MILTLVSTVESKTITDVLSVTLPTISGVAEVKKGHAEYFTGLVAGKIMCRLQNGSREEFSIAEAVCWVYEDEVKVVI